MNEQIRSLENEIMVLRLAKNNRGVSAYEADPVYRRAVFARQVVLAEMVAKHKSETRISPEDQKANADYAAYVERNLAKQALMSDNKMSPAQELKAISIARGEVQPAPAVSAAQPLGRGGPIFSKAG